MNTDVLFSSKSEMWETPKDFFDKLDEEFHFDLDVCAIPENAKCKRYFTPEMDGLSQPWEGVCWCNPPYCRQTGKWVKKAYDESQSGNCTVVMLLPCRPDVAWFHDYILGRAEIRFIRGRLKFGGSKNSAPFPSMVVIFRPGEKDSGARIISGKRAEVIRAMAELDMNVSEVSRVLYMHRNTVVYYVEKIKEETGLDPKSFYDLAELVGMVDRMKQEG